MKPIAPPVAAEIKAVKDGTGKGGLFTGASGYAPFHDLDSQVPASVKTMMETILKGLTDGSITTGVSPAKPAQ
jgi:basic membrane protein A